MFNKIVSATLSFSLLEVANCQTQEEKDAYPLWAAEAERFDYSWEPHTVETPEGWFLTVFRITGVKGRKLYLEEENKDKAPILI